VSEELDALIHELADWLRIPSVSIGERNEAALQAAAEWGLQRVLAAGGSAELVESDGAPLVVGELRAARAEAPTVLIYGHYDVQDPGDEAAWTTSPFEPDIRGERIYARGASDDKGNFLPLLHVACGLADAGELPVHVRVLLDGAEESGDDDAIERWVQADARGADCAIVFDTGMLDSATPALTLGVRGGVFATIDVHTGERPLHSGEFGGAALNALHALHAALAAVLPGPDGRVPAPLAAGAQAPAPEEAAAWADLPAGAGVLGEAGGRPADARATADFYARTTAAPAVDVHAIEGGEARTVIPHHARAHLSVRLAAGQDPAAIRAALEELLRGALPAGAELSFAAGTAEPASFDPSAPPLALARQALARVCRRAPALVRTGGSLPVLGAFAARGIPVIVSGFALPEDNIHAPDESFALRSLELGRRAAHALYEDLAALS
jgi:acetylornithine deacetylase/succinyl-diaminopimelate desuccinylase-like protein